MGEKDFSEGFDGMLFLDDGIKQVKFDGLTTATFVDADPLPPVEDSNSLTFEIPRTEEISFSFELAKFQLPKEWEKAIKKLEKVRKKARKTAKNRAMRARKYQKRFRERIRRAKLKGLEYIRVGRPLYIMTKDQYEYHMRIQYFREMISRDDYYPELDFEMETRPFARILKEEIPE